jgi:hypothetical protein
VAHGELQRENRLERTAGLEIAMHISAYESLVERDAVDSGLLVNEMLGHDVYSLPEEDRLGLCLECGDLADDRGFLAHKNWCSRHRYVTQGPDEPEH